MDNIQQILGEFATNFDETTVITPPGEDYIFTALTAVAIFIAIVFLVILLIAYIYTSLTLHKTAERLNHPKPWYAWIPFLRIYLQLQLGDMNPLFLLLYISPILLGVLSIIPYIGAFFSFLGTGLSTAIIIVNTITYMNMSKKRGYDRELGLMIIAPLTGWILRGILAWGKKEPVI
jgi:hypothetical protein